MLPAPLSIALAALAGWLVGGLSAWWSARLVARDDPAAPRVRYSLLLRDAAVQVPLALAWAGLVAVYGPTWRAAASAILAVAPVQIAITDVRVRYVYLYVVGPAIFLALVLSPYAHDRPLTDGVVGAGIGAIILLVFYGLGLLIARYRYHGQVPLAFGDVQIGTLVGAIAGAQLAFTAIFLGALISGILALVVLALSRSRHAYLPYGPGLCVAAVLALFVH